MFPSEWHSTTLGDLVAFEYGVSLPENKRTGGRYPVYGSSGEVGRHKEYLVPNAGIIVGRKGTVGAVTWSSEAFWPIDTTYYLVPRKPLNFRWLYWYLRTLGLNRLDSSTGVPGLNRTDAYLLPVLEPPLSEQERIAEILDTIDTAIQRTEALIAKLKAAKAGLLHDLLTRGLDENGQLRDPERNPELFKQTELGLLPRGWSIISTEGFLASKDGIKPGPFGSSITKASYVEKGYKVYGQEQVIAGDLSVGNYFISEQKYRELSAFQVQEGDILISLVGTPGKVLIVKAPFEAGIINPRLMRLRPEPTACNPRFFKYLFDSPIVQGQLQLLSQGGTMPVLSGKVLRRLVLQMPPIGEQNRIADILDTHARNIDKEQVLLSKLHQLKRGLMEDLLTGRVRVPLAQPEAAQAEAVN